MKNFRFSILKYLFNMLIIIIFVTSNFNINFNMKRFYFAIVLLSVLLVGCKPEAEAPIVVTQEVTDVAQNQIRLLCSDYPIKLKTYSYPTKSNAQIEICFTLDSGREVKFTASYKTIGE